MPTRATPTTLLDKRIPDHDMRLQQAKQRQVITVLKRITMETTAVECDTMRHSRRCNESSMMKSENKWIFNQEPEDVGYWLRTTPVGTVNCMLEEVVLSRIDEEDMINTPLGKANVSHGSLSHNHLTLFWIDTYGKPAGIAIRQLEKGAVFCSVPSVIKDIVTKRNDPLDINIRQNARIQYLEDAAIRHENKLIRVIQRMQCDQRRAKHAQAVSTAQYNGWLAASQLGLRQCIKLIAAGNIVSALEL
ncbi:Uncharacterized protein APZ42_031125 [Daphnia magna]|uniref:Uncharacterized protein n=1 Tax=Daphnia magna TaxID=35525 RepID=A0A164N4D3_9CRUS|nr:Uncharacterized protein APZ42_031125 [Daphnia magna]